HARLQAVFVEANILYVNPSNGTISRSVPIYSHDFAVDSTWVNGGWVYEYAGLPGFNKPELDGQKFYWSPDGQFVAFRSEVILNDYFQTSVLYNLSDSPSWQVRGIVVDWANH